MRNRKPTEQSYAPQQTPSAQHPVRRRENELRTVQPTPAELRRQQKAAMRELEDAQYVRVYTGIDRPFMILVLVLLAFGVIMGFSASYSYASHEYGDSLHFFKRNLIFAAIGIIAMFLCLYIPIEGFRMLTFPAYGFSALLLILVLFIGRSEGDAKRWLVVPGVGITFQPSELAKLAMVMLMAWYISRFHDKITDYAHGRQAFLWGFCGCCCVFGAIAALVALENHISGTLIICAIGVMMMFVGRVKVKYLIGVAIILGAAAVFLIFVSGYGQTRVSTWWMILTSPESIPAEVARNEAYQNLQGLYAIGSGGIFGVGLGNSFQKYGYVSQPQNDFIFSIICEELGFIGAIFVILLFIALAWRGFIIARNAPDLFSSLLVFGIVIQVVVQAMLNIAVVTGSIPNTGISLPFFSSGGTSLVILMTEMGVVLSVSRYSYQRRS